MSQPVIIKNKIVYGYMDKTTVCRDMGRTDYNDLTEAQQLNGDVCFIQGVDASAFAPTNSLWNKVGTTPLASGLPADCSQAINQLKSNLTELNNYVTATLPNSTTDLNVNYPSGYTYDNCYVVAILVNDSQGIWRVGEGMATGSERIFIQMKQSYMVVLNNEQGFYSRPIRIVLNKLGSDITPT